MKISKGSMNSTKTMTNSKQEALMTAWENSDQQAQTFTSKKNRSKNSDDSGSDEGRNSPMTRMTCKEDNRASRVGRVANQDASGVANRDKHTMAKSRSPSGSDIEQLENISRQKSGFVQNKTHPLMQRIVPCVHFA